MWPCLCVFPVGLLTSAQQQSLQQPQWGNLQIGGRVIILIAQAEGTILFPCHCRAIAPLESLTLGGRIQHAPPLSPSERAPPPSKEIWGYSACRIVYNLLAAWGMKWSFTNELVFSPAPGRGARRGSQPFGGELLNNWWGAVLNAPHQSPAKNTHQSHSFSLPSHHEYVFVLWCIFCCFHLLLNYYCRVLCLMEF